MSQDQNRYNEYDEVNLMPVFRAVKKFIGFISLVFLFFLRAVVRRYSLIIILVTVSIFCALAKVYFSKPLYHSSAIYSSNLFGNEFSEQFIHQLHDLTEEKNYPGLANHLNISEEDARKIKEISYEAFKQGSKDSTFGQPFKVHAFVYDYNLLDSLQYRILDYMENNEYALKRRTAKASSMKELAEKLEKEISQLDTIKKGLASGKFGASMPLTERKNSGFQNQNDFSYISPLETFSGSVDLYMKSISIKEEMALLKNYDLIQGFTKFVKPYSPRLFFDPFIFSVIGLALGILISCFLELKRLRYFHEVFQKLKEDTNNPVHPS